MTLTRIFTLAAVLLVSFSPLSAQMAPPPAPLQEGYDLFAGNRPLEAREFFRKQAEGANRADALLALSFVEAELLNANGSSEAFLEYVAAEPDAAKRDAHVDALWSYGQTEADKQLLEFLHQQSRNPYGRIAPLALYSLGAHYRLTGELEESRSYFDRIGTLDEWQIVGPFENISESGFDRDFGVLAHPEPSATFTGKPGLPLRWQDVTVTNHTKWLSFGYFIDTDDAAAFAQTFCQSPRDQDVVMRLGTTGSVRVWVNDAPVFSEIEERDNTYDTYRFGATLKKGANRILVQIGASGDIDANFALRITDGEGTLVPGLTASPRFASYPKATPRDPIVYTSPAVAYFEDRLQAGRAHFVDYLTLGQHYVVNGFTEEARRVYSEALNRYPGAVTLQNNLRHVLTSMDDKTGASRLERDILAKAPESAVALLVSIEEAENEEDWPAIETALNRLTELYGHSEETHLMRIGLAGAQEKVDVMFRLIDLGLQKYPANDKLVLMKSMIASQVKGNRAEAIRILERYQKHHLRENVAEALIGLYENEDDYKAIVKMYGRLAELNPQSVVYDSKLSQIEFNRGDYPAARRYIQQVIDVAPTFSNFHYRLGDINEKDGRLEEARAAYHHALALDPYNFDSRESLRRLEGQPTSPFTIFPEADAYASFADAPSAEDYPSDNSIILNYDTKHIVHEGGASEMHTTLLVKVLNPEGVDAWKEYTLPIYGNESGMVETLEVIEPDGSRHEASRSGTDVVFDRLEPGGGVLIVFRKKDSKTGRMRGKWWNDHALTLGYPMLRSSFSLLLPPGTAFDHRVTGQGAQAPEPERSTLEGRDLYTWTLERQAAIEAESNTIPFADLITSVRVTNVDDWAYIADWYAELTHAKIRPDDYVRQAVAELFDEGERLSEREEVERIYTFVTNDIRYISVPFLQSNYVPQSPSKTLVTRQGDCKDVSSLFVAMCEVRGVHANLVLISTRDLSQSDLTLPGIGFNHCIARVELDDEPYFVELTDENLPFGTGDWSVNNAFGLVIPREGETYDGSAGLINPPSRGVNEIIRTGTIVFDGKDMVYTLDNYKTNKLATNVRHTYELESPENREKDMLAALSDSYPRIALESLEFGEGLTDLSDRVNYRYTYRAVDPATEIGGMRIFPIVFSDRMRTPDYISTVTRKLPIDLWFTFQAEHYEQTLLVETPENAELVDVPQGTTIENPYFSYRVAFTPVDGNLHIKRSFRLLNDRVPPSAYASFKEDMQQLVEADDVQLAYRDRK